MAAAKRENGAKNWRRFFADVYIYQLWRRHKIEKILSFALDK
jgi:hypothetical protein